MTAYQIDVKGTGRNTQSLLNEALRLQNEYEKNFNRNIDRLWVVFDRDSFSANNFNSAVYRCKDHQPEIGCAWSNEAFELWYLLHFQYLENAMSRMDYPSLIENNLKPILGNDYRYKKNSEEMYALLKEYGNQANAIRYGKRLALSYGQGWDYANQNPCTMVWKLVEELLELNE
ncbi:RloB family protein [Membranihabitans marinus]|uniref:RloB family protein n=1 Tax=Membranihabitans marinus TaxID=1227546 RepID=UPI001F3F20BF|nr:RloB family protein [Membranihabitans marinus]